MSYFPGCLLSAGNCAQIATRIGPNLDLNLTLSRPFSYHSLDFLDLKLDS